ncbi:HlyIII-domain-containing protein [Piromyces finnis]|uniref:HlyIII-domain-containing protein n=1 Tax=Piromyces finnis TaxID=1754191 RepID=A0A1Y1VP07_9FUNG|nr:HlyIII-domain-containing protein [Piromyces finnis]|eukprot:ORX61145.1 HlyIII-domain-containing protein [Piromyces finnis]
MENGHLKLIKFSQCPDWLSDNPYIVSNYRPPCYSYKACYKSLLYLHNETGNIYSHIIGAILFTSFYGFTAYKYIPSFNDLDSLQILSIIMSVIGGFICMFFSYHFHMFSSHSLKVNRNWLTCDFIGIVSLIYTTGLPLSYYSFYCLPDFRVKYMAVSAIIGAISLLSMLNPVFSRDEYRLVRSGLFLLLAISELLPVLYAVINFNNDILVNYLSIHWTISGALMYLLGLFLYAKRIPEIYLPGKFDVWGHSHQLFHTLIVFASVSFYIGIMKTVKSYNMDEDVCSKLY